MANASARAAATSSAERADIYTRITNQIIASLERGAGQKNGLVWRMPWHHDGAATHRPVNAVTAKPYRGMNILALWAAAEGSRFTTGLWGTYRQWSELGAQVRKGERATLGVVWKCIDAGDGDEEAEGHPKSRMFARGFYLFNVAQVDGYTPPETPILPESARIAIAVADGLADLKNGRSGWLPSSRQAARVQGLRARIAAVSSVLSARLSSLTQSLRALYRRATKNGLVHDVGLGCGRISANKECCLRLSDSIDLFFWGQAIGSRKYV